VLNALREVEDALVAYRTDRAGRNKLAEAVRSGERALYLARDSYTQGLADFIQVLDPERTLIGSRRQLVQTDVMLTDDVVSLYDALGGGWQDSTAGLQPPPVDTTAPPMVPAALDSLAAAPPR
jgi:multidrug efflux system outer membrane protein